MQFKKEIIITYNLVGVSTVSILNLPLMGQTHGTIKSHELTEVEMALGSLELTSYMILDY